MGSRARLPPPTPGTEQGPATSSTTLAAEDDYGNSDDNSGLWGLAGLLGLLGLLGLRRRDHHNHSHAGTSVGATGTSAAAPTVPRTDPTAR